MSIQAPGTSCQGIYKRHVLYTENHKTSGDTATYRGIDHTTQRGYGYRACLFLAMPEDVVFGP